MLRSKNTKPGDIRIDNDVSEKAKGQAPYLMAMADALIQSLVKPSRVRRIARRYYLGQFDAEEFDYLTNNAGIGNVAELRFIPLIKTTVEALKGQVLGSPPQFSVRATDKSSLLALHEERLDLAISEMLKLATEKLAGLQTGLGQLQQNAPQPAPNVGQGQPAADSPLSQAFQLRDEQRLTDLHHAIENFQGAVEEEADALLREQVRRQKLDSRAAGKLMENLCVEGLPMYRIQTRQKGQLPLVKIVPPHQGFFPTSEEGPLCERSSFVMWERIPKHEVLARYGGMLTKTEREMIRAGNPGNNSVDWVPLVSEHDELVDPFLWTELQTVNGQTDNTQEGQVSGRLVPMRPAPYSGYDPNDLVDVYTVEWIATNPVYIDESGQDEDDIAEGARLPRAATDDDFDPWDSVYEVPEEMYGAGKRAVRYREDRYCQVRIGDSMYPVGGRDRMVSRSVDDPWSCNLTFDGEDYGSSMVYDTKDLQDSYNILHYLQENLIGNSGVPGSYVNIADIPSDFGNTDDEKLRKWIAYKKQGLGVVDTSQEGERPKSQFNNYGEFGASISGDLVTALQNQIEATELKASRITGVPPQVLASISSQDLVGTTEQAIMQSTVVTKPMFVTLSDVMGRLYSNWLNAARLAFENEEGVVAQMLLGPGGMRLFTFNARRFTLADFLCHTVDSRTDEAELATLKQMGVEMVKAQMVDPEQAVDIALIKSVPEARRTLKLALRSKNGQQLQNVLQQLKEIEAAKQQLEAIVQQRTDQQVALDLQKGQADIAAKNRELDIKQQQINDVKNFNDEKISLDKEKNQLERDQIVAAAPSGKSTQQAAEVTND